MKDTILQAENLVKHYGQQSENNDESNIVKAVDDVSLNAMRGEFVTIVGRSGCGKTTLLNLLGGLDKADSGSISVMGETYDGKTEDDLTVFRRENIGFIFQSYNLLQMLNVKDNILLPLGLDKSDLDVEYFEDIITTLRIENMLNKSVSKLSGGEQQRVAIARALVTNPEMILGDEPTGNLDYNTGNEVLALIKKSIKKWNQLFVMVTHDLDIAKESDRTIHMSNGKITGIEKNGEQ